MIRVIETSKRERRVIGENIDKWCAHQARRDQLINNPGHTLRDQIYGIRKNFVDNPDMAVEKAVDELVSCIIPHL